MRRAAAGDDAGAALWSERFIASRDSGELRAEAIQMGYSLTRLVAELGEADVGKLGDEVSPPSAFACTVCALDIAHEDALLATLFAWAENQVLVCVKSVPLGQVAGQRLLLSLAPAIERAAAVARQISDDEHPGAGGRASINLEASARMQADFPNLILTLTLTLTLTLILIESGGGKLAATCSPELSDLTLSMIDVAGGEKIPRKGGPGISRSDLLIINKTDPAPHVGADLNVMAADAARQRGDRPFVFTNLRSGVGVDAVMAFIREQGLLDAVYQAIGSGPGDGASTIGASSSGCRP